MTSWRRALVLGLLAWLGPFAAAFVVFPFRETARPLFESVMAVAVAATAVGLGLVYMGRARTTGKSLIREGLLLGLIWLVMCVMIDAPLMLLGGPMQMTFGDYMADIGLTYVTMPIVTGGLAVARTMVSGGAHERSSRRDGL